MVAVNGDQPIFKMPFKLWLRSYIDWMTRGAKVDVGEKEDTLCRWMVLLPRGFHIDEQGITPLVKEMMWKSGVEQLLSYSGLSASLRKAFLKFGQYRPNRKFLLQIVAAIILRLDESLSSISSSFSAEREQYLQLSKEKEMLGEQELRAL